MGSIPLLARTTDTAPGIYVQTDKSRKKSLKDCDVVLFQEFTLHGVYDRKDPFYYDITCLSDGKVVIVDNNNRRCCLYDSSYNHMSDWMLPSNPWGICTIDTHEVGVALPEEKKIQFLQVGDKIQTSGHINTRRGCMSVVALNKIELVYVGTSNMDKTYYWGVINRDGQEKSCFHISRDKIEHSDVYIVLNSSKTHVYISLSDNNTVYCVGLDGREYFQYKVKEGEIQRSPKGIKVDRENNVYVVVNKSNCIHRLFPDGQLQQTSQGFPKFPNALCFKQSGDSFLLTTNLTKNSNVCYVYRLE